MGLILSLHCLLLLLCNLVLTKSTFCVKLLFSDMDAASSVDLMDFSCLEEKDGLPIEVFSKVHEFFNQVDWVDQTDATRNMLQHLAIANAVQDRPDANSSPRLQGLSPKSIHDIMRHATIENSAKFKLSSMSEVETIDAPEKRPTSSMSEVETFDAPEKRPTDSVKKLIAEDRHAVLQISSQENTTNQDAKELLRQESPSLKLVHHSATIKPVVDGSGFSENADENFLKSPPPENNGEAVSFSPSTPSRPHPARTPLAPTGAPPPPPPLPNVASQPSQQLQHSVVQPAEPLSQGNSWVSLAGSTFHRTTPNEKLPTTLPSTPPPLPPASHVFPQESSKITNSSSVLPSPALSATPANPTQTEKLGSFCPPTSPQIGASDDVASHLGQPARLPPPVSNSDKMPALRRPPPPPPPPMRHSDQNTVTRVCPPIPPPPPPPAPTVPVSPPAPPTPQSNGNSASKSSPPPPPPPRLPGSTPPPTAPPPPPLGQSRAPSAPPPPPPKLGTSSSPSSGTSVPPTPALPTGSLSSGKGRMLRVNLKNNQTKKLKPYHWLKLTRAVNGSLWAETQMSSEASKYALFILLSLISLMPPDSCMIFKPLIIYLLV